MRNYISTLRKSLDLSQEKMGAILNVSRATIGSWENGRTDPSLETLVLISEKFNVSIDWLLTGKEYKLTNDENEMLKNYRSLNDDLKKNISETIKSAAGITNKTS